MDEVVPKIRRTRDEIDRRGLAVAIEVDGGIDVATAPVAARAGASVFVAGSAVFGEPDPAAAAHAIRLAADRAARPGPAEPTEAGQRAEVSQRAEAGQRAQPGGPQVTVPGERP